MFPPYVTVVDIQSLKQTDPALLAITAAAGLENREQPTVYTIRNDNDVFWKEQLFLSETENVSADVFLEQMVDKYGVILYSKNDIRFLPSIVTFAGVYSAIPMEVSYFKANFPSGQVVLNFTDYWKDDKKAVSDTANAVLQNTTTLAIQSGEVLQQGFLVDLIVAKKMFVEYLHNSCFLLMPENSLLKRIVSEAPWEKPVSVFGYNDATMIFEGFLFEAETNCINTLGQIPTQYSLNLSFFSNYKEVPVLPNISKTDTAVYSSDKIYVNFIYGDMDNIDIVKGFGHENMQKRVEKCLEKKNHCFPLTWTLSPNLRNLAPQIALWYYNMASQTGQDEFIMPPSGILYSYPGEMPFDVQANYASKMVDAASWMNTNGSVHWEWMLTWDSPLKNYFPLYKNHAEKNWAFFLNNVPWPVPMVSLYISPFQNYKWVEENVVVFKPAWNWDPSGTPGGIHDSPSDFAAKINALKPGSVNYIYVIQNAKPEFLFELVDKLNDNVEVISSQDLISLSKQRDSFME